MPRTEHPVVEDPNLDYPCSTCAECKPRTLAYFPKDSWMPDGLSVRCRKCASQSSIRSRRARRARERAEAAMEASAENDYLNALAENGGAS